ncbi:hypothetical protein CTI12_AA593030 [Artemisia annua]|uniref:Uncharacterized protein n=1 Tax=Artemisia annua TaxID=35608 RepID=A0A2U1KK64_ARTAN|nr:hypothetical protein CTI12_AA593030 [Artemisia annua]
MKRKEKQEKFHNSLINLLYAPPSPSPSPSPPDQFHDQTLNLAREIVNSNHHPPITFEKLTRAQRKRLRKKKLKEAACNRREIIGPELPPGKGEDDQQPEGVRRNAAERVESGIEHCHRGETPSCIKVKHRRMSKKKAMEKQKAYPTDLSRPADKS